MKSNKVLIVSARNLAGAVSMICQEFGISDVAGKSVFIKPNMFRGARVEEASVTHPGLLTAMVRYFKKKEARVLVGDNSVPNKARTETEIARQCGFIEASLGCFCVLGQRSKKIEKRKGFLKEVYVSKAILECDTLISLPKFRTHELTVMTLAVKNHFGIIPGGLKPAIHARFPKIDDFSRVLLEVYAIRPPDLVVVDCIEFLDARGKKFQAQVLVAGTCGLAVDHVCARIAGIEPRRIPTLKIAEEQKLYDPLDIQVIGELPKLKGYRVPFAFPFRNTIIEFFAQILYILWLRRRPYIHRARCTHCELCEGVCPVHAIKNLHIDTTLCIKCFCCFEVCPNRAIRTRFKL